MTTNIVEQNALISVVIPSYNYAHLLPRAIESVVEGQSGARYELLVIDDGSVDNTPEVVRHLLEKYTGKFRYLRQKNVGLAATRNKGALESKGAYLLFLDADDALCDGVLQKIQESILNTSSPVLLVCGYYANWGGGQLTKRVNGRLRGEKKQRVADYLFTKRLSIAPSATFIKKTVFDSLKFDEEIVSSEDMPFFTAVLTGYDDVVSLDIPVVEMTRHPESMRNDFVRAERGTELLEKAISDVLTDDFGDFSDRFHTKRLLTLSRLAFLSAEPEKGRRYYLTAIKRDWHVLFNWSYTRKFLKGLFKK